MRQGSKWGFVPIGLVMLGMTWMAWNVDNLEADEQSVQGTITGVSLNTPTIAYTDLSGEQQTIVGELEDQPPTIGSSREVVLSTNGDDPRLRNTNPKWLVVAFGAVAMTLVLTPFLHTLWRVLLGGGTIAAGAWLGKRTKTALSGIDTSGTGTIVSDAGALKSATLDQHRSDASTQSATKEAAGAVLIAEGIVGIENPFTSRSRGGLYSSLIGVLVGVGLFFYAPIVGSLLTGDADDVRVDGVVVDSIEVVTTQDDGTELTMWQPVLEYVDPATESTYTYRSSNNENERPRVGDTAQMAFPAENPAGAIVVESWGQWVRRGIVALGVFIVITGITTFVMRAGALVAGFHLLRNGRAERREHGDTRSTIEVIKDSASEIIGRVESGVPEDARGGLLATLVATRRQGRNGQTVHAARDVVGATLLADSLFGLEQPFDGENTRLGVVGHFMAVVVFASLIPLGVWLGNEMGYVGDRLTATGEVVEFVEERAVIEYSSPKGETFSLVEQEKGTRVIGNQLQVVFEADSPESAEIAQRGAAALRWLLIGTGVVGVLGLTPTVLLQLAGVFVGLGLLVGVRRP